jgi:hypothetical protein
MDMDGLSCIRELSSESCESAEWKTDANRLCLTYPHGPLSRSRLSPVLKKSQFKLRLTDSFAFSHAEQLCGFILFGYSVSQLEKP